MPLHPVRVSGFEGPLDLLLELIEAEKLDVTQVSLAQVTDQYLEHIRSLENLSPEELAQFLVVAARLILLKSKRLLPQFALEPEEEESIASLEEQLREYQKYRLLAGMLRSAWAESRREFARESYLGVTISFFPPPGITPQTLTGAVTAVVKSLPVVDTVREEMLARVVSLEERIRDIQQRVKNAAVTSFEESMAAGAAKIDVIVSFLAVLELVKQRLIEVEQHVAFRDILIRRRSPP